MNDQRSVNEQLDALIDLANKNGLYDAADWVRKARQATSNRMAEVLGFWELPEPRTDD